MKKHFASVIAFVIIFKTFDIIPFMLERSTLEGFNDIAAGVVVLGLLWIFVAFLVWRFLHLGEN